MCTSLCSRQGCGEVSNNSPAAPAAENALVQSVQGRGSGCTLVGTCSIPKVGCVNSPGWTVGQPVFRFCGITRVYCARNVAGQVILWVLFYDIEKENFVQSMQLCVSFLINLLWNGSELEHEGVLQLKFGSNGFSDHSPGVRPSRDPCGTFSSVLGCVFCLGAQFRASPCSGALVPISACCRL